MAKPSRLKPGATTTVPAMQGDDGDVVWVPEDSFKVLSRYWSQVFRAGPFDKAAADRRID